MIWFRGFFGHKEEEVQSTLSNIKISERAGKQPRPAKVAGCLSLESTPGKEGRLGTIIPWHLVLVKGSPFSCFYRHPYDA